jgi:hypothetical protein
MTIISLKTQTISNQKPNQGKKKKLTMSLGCAFATNHAVPLGDLSSTSHLHRQVIYHLVHHRNLLALR